VELVTKMFICARESVVRSKRGQTMTEYALHHRGMRMAIQKTHERLEVCLSELTKLRPIVLLCEDVLGKELGFRAGLQSFERTLNLFYRISKRNLEHIPHANLQAIAADAEKTVDQFRKIVDFSGEGIENPQEISRPFD